MVRARIIKNTGAQGEVEWIDIRKNIMNTCAKIKNIVDFASNTNEMERIQWEKEWQIEERHATVSLMKSIRSPMTDGDARVARMDH
jgi:hypothetical protein